MICRILASNFRNLERLDLPLAAGSTLVAGPTGAGKTSLLEALYVVATSRSFRSPKLAACRRLEPTGGGSGPSGRNGDPGFALGAEIERARRVRLDLAWSAHDGLTRQVNSEAAPVARYLEACPTLVWSAAEGETLVGAPALRRRLLDRGLVGLRPQAVDLLARYRRGLEHKRALLQSGRPDAPSLSTWNQLLSETGAEIVRRRGELAQHLGRAFAEAFLRSGLGWPHGELRYRPSGGESAASANGLFEALERAAADEIRCRQATVGPHRDRLDVVWRGRPVRDLASAGERKALALLLLAAQAEVLEQAGRAPVVLLDDLDAELDRTTLQAIWRVFAEDAQRVVSSNRPTVFEGLAMDQRWNLEDGRIRSC